MAINTEKGKGNVTAVSLFSGCGGFDWGVQQAGVRIIWANDIDPCAEAAYRHLFPDTNFVSGDIRDVMVFPEADILIGCYPCTGFSLGSRRRWKDAGERDLKADQRNYLYEEFIRALGQVKPKYIFIENVRGMLSAESGWFFDRQLEAFNASGYTIQHDKLHAADYGVPQSRKRVFIVGVRKDIKAFEYRFPLPSHGQLVGKPYNTIADAIGSMPDWPEGEFLDYPFHGHFLTRNRKRPWDGISYTIVANSHHVPLHPIGLPMRYVGKDHWELQGDQNRRLSWRECAAIQGLPANISPGGNLDDKYRVVGNAVPPAFGFSLVKSVVDYESKRTG
ncbi:MAG TPA: DNA cytosine methyltransferase [Capsulimonadaceae bacterium]|jgi:DNA (cytosine-5)-methyltransferase 1